MTSRGPSFDLLAVYPHLAVLLRERPRDASRYELARARATEVFKEFVKSPEHAVLDDGTRWSTLVMRAAYVRHGVTIDELDSGALREVAGRFVLPNDAESL